MRVRDGRQSGMLSICVRVEQLCMVECTALRLEQISAGLDLGQDFCILQSANDDAGDLGKEVLTAIMPPTEVLRPASVLSSKGHQAPSGKSIMMQCLMNSAFHSDSQQGTTDT